MSIAGLYSGFGWLALGRILGVATRFGTYELVTAFYKGMFFIPCAIRSYFVCSNNEHN